MRKTAKAGYKFCSKCEKELPATTDFFLKQSSNKSGLSSQCKKCRHKYYENNKDHFIEKSRIYYGKNQETALEKQKEYYKQNVEHKKDYDKEYASKNREKINARYRKYVEKNKDKMEKYRKSYYKENKNRIKEVHQKWRSENRDRVKMARKRRRYKKRVLTSDLSIEQWEQAKLYFNNECAYCGESSPLEQDHFIPSSKGGEYTKNNIIPACRSCNASKNDSDFQEWYVKQEIYDSEMETRIFNYLNLNKKINDYKE